MGDREKQNEIRSANPEVEHCELLLINAGACNGCPKNPEHGKKAVDRDLVEKHMPLIERSLELAELAETGLIAGMTLRPYESIAMRFGVYRQRHQRDERLAKMVGAQTGRIVAELMAKMFSR